MAQNWFRQDIGSALAERTALLAAIASTGRTFGRGLMPRNTAGQALATGLTGSVNYGLLVTSQSALWAGASMAAARLMPADLPEGTEAMDAYRGRVRAIAYGTYGASALAARPLARLVPQEPGESVARGLTRGYLQRLELVSLVGLVSTGILDAAYSGLNATDMSRRQRRTIGTGLMLAGGTALATTVVHRERTRRAEATGEKPPALSAASVGAGVVTAAGLTVLGKSESFAARRIGGVVPGLPAPAATAVGHAVCLGGLGVGIWQGVEHLYRTIEEAGSAVETMHAVAPDSVHVSGGPASALDWSIMSREGRRFAGLPLSAGEIAQVMGDPAAEPVRVFVPLGAADTPEERARIAVAEMEALGAFDRAVVVLCSPTGTGYINYVMAEAVEYLTRGDCAIVSTQYSLRPSFLSLDRVAIGRENARALLAAVQERVATMAQADRPRLVMFGESLGAHTGQDVALHQGVAGFEPYGIDRALFIGTPDESGWATQWRADPVATDPRGVVVEVDSFEEFQALPEARRDDARIVLISHHEDPITKFGPELAIRRPEWLDPERAKRPPGIPPEMDWRPLTTFFVTVSDVINSMTVVPGQFGADGHDYREDLARFVSAAYDLPCTPEELARIESALRARELAIAESRLVAEQVGSAQQATSEKLARWGVDEAVVSTLIEAEVARSGGVRPGMPSEEPAPEAVAGPSDEEPAAGSDELQGR